MGCWKEGELYTEFSDGEQLVLFMYTVNLEGTSYKADSRAKS